MITVPFAAVALLYTRMDTPSILGHATRRGIVEAVGERPGTNLRELSSSLGVDPKTISYHVRCLHRAGQLRIDRRGAALCCFLPGIREEPTPTAAEAEALAWLELGATGPADLARAMRIPRGTAGSILDRLARRGLMERTAAPKEPFSPEGG